MKDKIYRAIARICKKMSLSMTHRIGAGLGSLLWLLLRKRARLATQEIVYNLEVPEAEAKRIAKASFRNTGMSFFEIFQSHKFDREFIDKHVRIVDRESFQAMVDTKRPMVGVTGHMGSWEMMAGACVLLLPQTPKVHIVKPTKDAALNTLMDELRNKPGFEMIPHRNAVLKVLRTLKKGGVASFLVDHNCSTTEAIFMPFLKKVAAVNMGPALLAVRGRAVVQPVFFVRESGGYALYTEKALDTTELTGSNEEKIKAVAEFYTQAVERIIRKYPDQWYWLHRRWKTRPPEGWTYGAAESAD